MDNEFIERALKQCADSFHIREPAKFYGPSTDLSLGSGMIVEDAHIPVLDLEKRQFRNAYAASVILTHECDIDQFNNRAFNDFFIVCPLIGFSQFVEHYVCEYSKSDALSFLDAICKDQVHRMMYLPPTYGHLSALEKGCFLYLNNICHSSLKLHKPKPVVSLSAIGLQALDFKLNGHLFREKAQRLLLDNTRLH